MSARGLLALAALLAIAAVAPHDAAAGYVTVEIVSDRGYALPLYELPPDPGGARRFYAEALPGDYYVVRVNNVAQDEPLAVVISVDGVNVADGRPSSLSGTEAKRGLSPSSSIVADAKEPSTKRLQFPSPIHGDGDSIDFPASSAPGFVGVSVFRGRAYPFRAPLPDAAEFGGPGPDDPEPRPEGLVGPSVPYESSLLPDADPSEVVVIKYATRRQICEKRVIACPDEPAQPRLKKGFWD